MSDHAPMFDQLSTSDERTAARPVPVCEPLDISVVIATRNRPTPISETLASLNLQTRLPAEVVVIDSSDNQDTEHAIGRLRPSLRYPVLYERCSIRSSARQRNIGAAKISSEIVSFLDDDLDLEPEFLAELLAVFENDPEQSIGGVTGAIRNQPYVDPHGLNRLLLAPCLGRLRGTFAGLLLGPAVNFLPAVSANRAEAVSANPIQDVEWLPSCCVAYRREIFLKEQFPDFEGYSFAEDVHLSSRVARHHRVVCNNRAGVQHHDLGKDTHKDWKALGRSMVLNRYAVMTEILKRSSFRHFLQLAYFELFYSSITWMAAGFKRERLAVLKQILTGKLAAFSELSRLRLTSGGTKP